MRLKLRRGNIRRAAHLGAGVALAVAGLIASPQRQESLVRESAPELVTFVELVELSAVARPTGELAERLGRLLDTPFVNNEAFYRGAGPKRPLRGGMGYLRAARWNIERGSEFDFILHSLTDPDAFERALRERVEHEPAALDDIRAEAHLLVYGAPAGAGAPKPLVEDSHA